MADRPDGFWAACRACATVFWHPYGVRTQDVHRVYLGCDHTNRDEGALERAEDEADFLNDLEGIAAPTELDAEDVE